MNVVEFCQAPPQDSISRRRVGGSIQVTTEPRDFYFINRGSTFSIELPLGSYKLKFASGEKWYGMQFLFGPRTSYSYIPDKMTFYLSGDYARGQRIELIPQVGGNLHTRLMTVADW